MKVIKYPTGGVLGEAERFILDNQLLRRDLWRDFVSMFRLGLDSDNNGWRGEYFGKMMRGGCFTYALTRDRELYGVLTEAIEDILTTQRPDGVISSYRAGEDYRGWDMWARKYVLLAMFYYMEICADDRLKKRVLDSAKRQLKAIMRVVGPAEDGKTPITRTSVCWRGLNSSSILEPVMLYYKLTGDPELLKFAKHIVSCGGIDGDNIFRLASENRLAPYQYPVTKAYEMVSCMEGLLEYALCVDDREAFDSVVKFGKRVLETDFTVIGSGGTTHELFDHSSWRQSSAGVCEIAQETCVTVTFMKFFSRLYRETGDNRFADAVETSFYNAYLGALNTQKQTESGLAAQLPGANVGFLPFDSYSPLTMGRRGKKIGGFMVLPGNRYYGCCACIGSLGGAVAGLTAVQPDDNGFELVHYFPGSLELSLSDGTRIDAVVKTDYPYGENVELIFDRIAPAKAGGNADFSVSLRIPVWSTIYELTLPETGGNGTFTVDESRDGLVTVSGPFKAGDRLRVSFVPEVRIIRPVLFGTEKVGETEIIQDPAAEERICVKRGALTLAAVNDGTNAGTDLTTTDPLLPASAFDEDAVASARWEIRKNGLAGTFTAHDGSAVTLVDYAGAGKDWNGPEFGAWFRIG